MDKEFYEGLNTTQSSQKIKLTTGSIEEMDLPLGGNKYSVEVRRNRMGREEFVGNLYENNEQDLKGLCSSIEAIPELLEFVWYYGIFKDTPLEDRVNLVSSHEKLNELYEKLKHLPK